ncbi:MAG: hypothetical protein WEB52_01075 [Dehalococcoidia bacterium]
MDLLARACCAIAVVWHVAVAALIANLIWFADSANDEITSVVGLIYLGLAGTVVIPAGMWGLERVRRGPRAGA